MYRIVQGAPVGNWVAWQLGSHFDASHSQAIGLEKTGSIVAGAIFEDFNQRSIVAHIAFRGRTTRKFLIALGEYPFRSCKVEKLIAPVASDNGVMIKMAYKMGFKLEAVLRDCQPKGHILLFTMTADQCRFLGEKYNGKIQPDSAAHSQL